MQKLGARYVTKSTLFDTGILILVTYLRLSMLNAKDIS